MHKLDIKAKCRLDREWIYGFYHGGRYILEPIYEKDTGDSIIDFRIHEIIPETAGLFTGTIYGDEKVYVGDIVKYECSIESGIGEVVWDDLKLQFGIKWIKASDKMDVGTISPLYQFQCQSEMSVIGNIHGNKKEE